MANTSSLPIKVVGIDPDNPPNNVIQDLQNVTSGASTIGHDFVNGVIDPVANEVAKPIGWFNQNVADPIGNKINSLISPYTKALGLGSTPQPTTTPTAQAATPAQPAQLSYQATVAQAVAPLLKQLGSLGNNSTINQSLSGVPQAGAANSGEPNLASGISTSLQSQISDYQSGLNTMLNNVTTAQPIQDLLKGLGELISYPVALPGQSSAPYDVTSNNITNTIYDTLNAMRNYGASTTPSSSNQSGYNQSVASLVSQ